MSETAEDKINVVVAMDFSDEIMKQLRDVSPQLQIERHFPDVPDSVWETAEVLYTVRHFPDPEQAPRLRWIQLNYAGMEHVANRRIVQEAEDVEITSASGIHAVPMAEYSLAMMLAFMYKVPLMLKHKQQTIWLKERFEVYKPHGLRGLTVGLVGYGSIARELARICDAMGMSVLATKRSLKTTGDDGYIEPDTGDPTGDIPERLYPPEALVSMARECDFLVVTAPLTDETRYMVNEAVFEAMKDTAILINVARGGLVDEKALVSALAAEKIGGAALDVFEEEPLPATSPLWNLDNVILSPHVSGNSTMYHERAAALFVENLKRYVENRPLLNRYDREQGY